MDEKPWTTVAREQLGWLSYLTWPYRAYHAFKSAPKPETVRGLSFLTPPPSRLVGFFTLFFFALTAFIFWLVAQGPLARTSLATDVFWLSFLSGIIGFALVGIRPQGVPNLLKSFFVREPKRRSPDEIPTPEETKQAHNLLRVAEAFYQESFEQKRAVAQDVKLAQATKALVKAGALDPNAAIVLKDDKGIEYTESQDEMAAKLLYVQSVGQFSVAEKFRDMDDLEWIKRWNGLGDLTGHFRDQTREMQKYAEEAIPPAEKALRYEPSNMLYLSYLIGVYRLAGRRRQARQALAYGKSVAPDDIRILKLDAP